MLAMEWNVLVRFAASDVNNPANPAFKLDGAFPRPSQYPQLVFWYVAVAGEGAGEGDSFAPERCCVSVIMRV